MSQDDMQGSIPAIIRNDFGSYEGDLIPYFQVVFFEARNIYNPYHNFRHMMHVLWLCHEACIYYGDRLTLKERRNLLIAAMFHDMDHMGLPVDDSENIARAILSLTKNLSAEDRGEMEAITALIRATQFPYIIPDEELDLPAQILRDADVGQALDVAWIQQVIFGLAREWDKDPVDVLKMQRPFLESIALNTEWARSRFPQHAIDAKIGEAKELLRLLTQ